MKFQFSILSVLAVFVCFAAHEKSLVEALKNDDNIECIPICERTAFAGKALQCVLSAGLENHLFVAVDRRSTGWEFFFTPLIIDTTAVCNRLEEPEFRTDEPCTIPISKRFENSLPSGSDMYRSVNDMSLIENDIGTRSSLDEEEPKKKSFLQAIMRTLVKISRLITALNGFFNWDERRFESQPWKEGKEKASSDEALNDYFEWDKQRAEPLIEPEIKTQPKWMAKSSDVNVSEELMPPVSKGTENNQTLKDNNDSNRIQNWLLPLALSTEFMGNVTDTESVNLKRAGTAGTNRAEIPVNRSDGEIPPSIDLCLMAREGIQGNAELTKCNQSFRCCKEKVPDSLCVKDENSALTCYQELSNLLTAMLP